MNKKSIKPLYLLLLIVTFLLMGISLYLIFIVTPTERTMGEVQKIFYFHVPSAWTAFLAFFIVCIASIVFLKTGDAKWDKLAGSSAEIGILFTTLVLITGPLWAKPVWHVYWTWDARLTTSFILWLIYIAYLMLRSYTADSERGARFAAVFGIIGFIDVPIVYMSIRWWRTLHPSPVMAGNEGSGLAPEMVRTLMVSLVTFTFLFCILLMFRYKLAMIKSTVDYIKSKMDS